MKKYFVVTNAPESSPCCHASGDVLAIYDDLASMKEDYPHLLYLAVHKCEWDGGKMPTFSRLSAVTAETLANYYT